MKIPPKDFIKEAIYNHLHSQLIASMGSTIDDIESWNWHHNLFNTS